MTNRPQWRLIPFLTASGPTQMAIDTWLLRDYLPKTGQPTLRFYHWSPAAISLGCFQTSWPDQWKQLTWQADPLALVKRPTGGRAVLHQGSLTYSVVMPKGKTKRQDLYPCICQFLINAWQQLGIELMFGGAGRGYIHNPSCFNTATAADLVAIAGDKLIGSAQRQTQTGLLQHGSMVWDTDRRLFEQVFQQRAPWQKTLGELTGYLPLSQILHTLETSAADHFHCDLIPQPLTEPEWTAIAAYEKEFQVGDKS
ncbi:MAG: biotin/lipoate A/B protein ligase family protein [Synechocystis sp.]|nr:biotin/lipoate A/B protein ligase family protein [Synechocystis sp.]